MTMRRKVNLAGKVAVVTGGGRGLGRASALAFAAAGAKVVVVSRTKDELEEVVRLMGDDCGLAVTGDVSEEATAIRVMEASVERFGGVDILMNNAAMVGPFLRMEEVSVADWNTALSVNLKGAFLFARMAVPLMRRRGGGAIINVTSGLGSYARSPFGLYCIAKGGLNQLTRILALELEGDGIRVNGLDPSVMDTGMQTEIRAAGPQTLGSKTWQTFKDYKEKGLLKPAEKTARLALFLADFSLSFTGEIGDADHYASLGFAG
jgi:NAD(P)-dependent dehydrogenase (short-subunit alcohol dehydrogenase family)